MDAGHTSAAFFNWMYLDGIRREPYNIARDLDTELPKLRARHH